MIFSFLRCFLFFFLSCPSLLLPLKRLSISSSSPNSPTKNHQNYRTVKKERLHTFQTGGKSYVYKVYTIEIQSAYQKGGFLPSGFLFPSPSPHLPPKPVFIFNRSRSQIQTRRSSRASKKIPRLQPRRRGGKRGREREGKVTCVYVPDDD